MPIINSIGAAILWLIRAGVLTRTVYLFIRIMADPDTQETYKSRLKKMVIFYVSAESIYYIQAIIKKYFFQSSPSTINQISQTIIDLFS